MEIEKEVKEADNRLQDKILEHWTGCVVRKDLAFLVKGNLPVPTYVLEYLLAQYCASSEQSVIEEGLEKVKEVIREHYFNRADHEIIKGRIHEKGSYVIIDKVSAYLDAGGDQYLCSFSNLDLTAIPIDVKYIRDNEKLLSGTGVWCIVKLRFVPGDKVKSRWNIETFKPIQIAAVDVEDYIAKRKNFTTEEWMDFLIHTVGLNPCILNRREKFIVLARLLPYIENNYNFMELGPKGTGKSHVFQEFSPHGVLVSGGDVTSARLFVKISGHREILGLVGYWDNVAWDEFEQQPGKATDGVLIDTMQNYLANKAFNRGGATHEASASLCFVGNTKHNVQYMLRKSHLFESIPHGFIKGAFLDRIHLYNPGWEMTPLKKNSFSDGYGMITDYIAAILHDLRRFDYSSEMGKFVKFSGTLSERDHMAIRKTFSGFIKLLYPDGKYTDEEALEIIEYATEGRRRVKEQLYKIDETFKSEPAIFEYTLVKTGEKKLVQTLEEIENNIDDNGTMSANVEQGQDMGVVRPQATKEGMSAQSAGSVVPKLVPKHLEIREGQRGVSYGVLFGEYMKTAKRIVVVDPYIRKPYQFHNFVELLQTILTTNANVDSGIKIELHTGIFDDKEESPQKQNETLEGIKAELLGVNVDFDFFFDAVHDRYIVLDNGWQINLGRGLDIFEPFPYYSLQQQSQKLRRCKPFNVTIVNLRNV